MPNGPRYFVSSVSDDHDDEYSDGDDDECVPHESVAMVKHAAPAVNHGKFTSPSDVDTDSDDESTTAPSMSCVSYVSDVSDNSHASKQPGPLCLKGSAAYRGIDRSGIHLCLDGDVDIEHIEPVGKMRDYVSRSIEGILLRRPQRKLDQQDREERKQYLLASALNLAKCLSRSHGYPVHYGWPVEWSGSDAKFLHPPSSGIVCEEFISVALG